MKAVKSIPLHEGLEIIGRTYYFSDMRLRMSHTAEGTFIYTVNPVTHISVLIGYYNIEKKEYCVDKSAWDMFEDKRIKAAIEDFKIFEDGGFVEEEGA